MDLPRTIEWTEKLWGTAQAGNRDLFGRGILALLNEHASQPVVEADAQADVISKPPVCDVCCMAVIDGKCGCSL